MNSESEKIMRVIEKNEYRRTASRQAIVDVLVKSEGHITADTLAEKVRKQAPRVGRMTVYRTLDLLSELGVVRPIYQGTGAAHYILMDEGSHHHLICNRCHDVIEFDECVADAVIEQVSKQFNFHIFSHLLELHGLCENCYE
ncbi:MAG: transcriptional repressor [Chloroflexota bacterium]